MTALSTSVRQTGEGPVITIDGELDHATAGDLRATLAALPLAAGQELVLDLTELRFCDSSGLAVFLSARGRADASGATIALTGVPAHTARLLRLTGLEGVLPARRSGETAPD